MKFLVDFFPVLAFFIAYFIPDNRSQGIYWATSAAIVASIIQVTIIWLMYKKVEKMHLITLAIILILGSTTLLLQDKRFIMWKPTVVNWAFAVVFLSSQYIGKKNIIQRMMEENIQVPDTVWKPLNFSWVIFFLLMGIINLYVAFNFSEEIWVKFKMFGMLGLTFIFAIGQSLALAKYIKLPEEEKE